MKYKMNGYTLHIIPTKKFKTITISLKLKNELKKETSTLRTLLTFMFTSGTKQLPSNQALSSYLDELYGARLSSNIVSKGQAHVINLFCTCVNPAYLPIQDRLLDKQIALLSDIILNPYCVNGCFDEDALKIKKKELVARIQSLKDDKYSYSFDRLLRIMGENDYLGISATGYEEEIDTISAKDLYDYYLQCLQNDEKDVYVVGDVDESIVDIFNQYMNFEHTPRNDYSSLIFKSHRQEVEEVIETQKINQAKLNMGFTMNTDFKSDSHPIMSVFNGLFGGFSHSRLFRVVREENSLCYYVSSSYDAFNGFLAVTAGIQASDYEKTKSLILEQLEDLQHGNIQDKELEMTKILLKDALTKSNDSALNMIAIAYNRDITGKEETTEEYISKIMNVTKEQIQEIASQIQLDTIFLLKGDE